MQVTCFICEEEFEITIEEAMDMVEEISNNEWICDDCANAAMMFTIERN